MGATQSITKSQNISLRYSKSQQDIRTSDVTKSVSSQDSFKINSGFKVAVLGIGKAVGKTSLICSLINQQPTILNHKQTLGIEVKFMQYKQRKIQFWEFDSMSMMDLENKLNDTFNLILIVFEYFDQELFRKNLSLVQRICNENKMTGRVQIHLIGNDKLDMRLTGKEKEINKWIVRDGNIIKVHIVDFTQTKELNNLLQVLFN